MNKEKNNGVNSFTAEFSNELSFDIFDFHASRSKSHKDRFFKKSLTFEKNNKNSKNEINEENKS